MSGPAQLRPLHVDLGEVSRPDGSALLCQGRTTVLAGVIGPGEVRPQSELIDRAAVEVSFHAKVGQTGIKDRFREALIKRCIDSVLVASLHPRTSISLAVQPMDDDGAELSGCLNAACLALMNASIPLKCLFAAVTVAVTTTDNGERTIIVDPTKKQEQLASVLLTFVFESANREILLSHVEGKCSEKELQRCLAMAKEASNLVFEFYRNAMTKKFSKDA